jgi:hypothetical protein
MDLSTSNFPQAVTFPIHMQAPIFPSCHLACLLTHVGSDIYIYIYIC